MLKRNVELNPAEILEADSSSGQTLGVTEAVPESVSMQSADQNYEVLPIASERNYKDQKTLENLETFSSLGNYFESVSLEDLQAERIFSNNVKRYISLKNTNPREIDASFVRDIKEFQNQSFQYDLDSIKFDIREENIDYYTLIMNSECFRDSKQKRQRTKVLLRFGMDSEGKIAYLHYPKVFSSEFF